MTPSAIVAGIMAAMVPVTAVADCANISTMTFGTPWNYNLGPPNGYPTYYIRGDAWATTWSEPADNKTYAANDDTYSWQEALYSTGRNLIFSTLSDYKPGLVGTIVNTMDNWGGANTGGSDNACASYKEAGLASVSGVLYMSIARQVYGNWNPTSGCGSTPIQTSVSAQWIKSTNHGTSWTPLPPTATFPNANPYAPPMFTSASFSAPWPIQYLQDYNPTPPLLPSMPDGADTYFYAVSSDGCWNNCSNVYLGRVLRTNLPNLSAGDWTFLTGLDGSQNPLWGALASAAPIVTNTKKIGMNGAQYLPALQCYVMIQWYYTDIAAGGSTMTGTSTQWDVYAAVHPWGPWSIAKSVVWNGTPGGFYNPNIIPKSLSVDGGYSAMLTTTGNFNVSDPHGGQYTLYLMPVTISQGSGGVWSHRR